MDIKVNIDKDAINETITKAILDSVIGVEMKRAIEESLSRLKSSYNNPIKEVVDKVVNDEIHTIIITQYRETIRAAIHEHITEEVISEMIDKAWNAFIKKY